MNLTNLEKATEILKEIKALDQQIIANEKLAMQLVNSDELVTISIGNSPGKKMRSVFNIPLLMGYTEEMALARGYPIHEITGRASDINPNEYAKQVTPPAAVRVCQFIHDDLVTRRSKYVSQLEKLGFKF